MREVILCADGDSVVYAVPDEVANNLRKYCIDFCNKWIWQSLNATQYRKTDENGEVYVVYCETDFIDYLNEYVFPEQKSVFVKNLGWTNFGKSLSVEYRSYPYFNF